MSSHTQTPVCALISPTNALKLGFAAAPGQVIVTAILSFITTASSTSQGTLSRHNGSPPIVNVRESNRDSRSSRLSRARHTTPVTKQNTVDAGTINDHLYTIPNFLYTLSTASGKEKGADLASEQSVLMCVSM